MITEKHLTKIGNSLGIIISSDMLQESGIQETDKVQVKVIAGKIEIEPVKKREDIIVTAAAKYLQKYRADFKKMSE
jgi:antitoxin component of MazEF toxin-antitoxin module